MRELLDYDPATGVFVWKSRPIESFANSQAGKTWNAKHAGKQTGVCRSAGYGYLWIDNRRYSAHRLAWLYVNGRWPESVIDHKDGDPGNNRLSNLREATVAQNAQAKKRPASNTSGIKGVSWSAKAGKWVAAIKKGGRATWLGHFDRKEDAAAAYQNAAMEKFGEFARLE